MMIIFKPLSIQFLWFWQYNYSTRQRCIDSRRYCISSCVEWLYVKSCWYSRNAIIFSVWISFNWNHLNEILILILSDTSKKELKKTADSLSDVVSDKLLYFKKKYFSGNQIFDVWNSVEMLLRFWYHACIDSFF